MPAIKDMLRILIFSFFLLAFSAYNSTAQVGKTDREKAGLVGPVRSVTSSSADFTGDKIEGKGYSIKPPETVSYDEVGNVLEEQMVSDFGEQMGKTVKKFDLELRLVENIWFDPKGKVVRKNVYVYDGGRLTESRTSDDKNVIREKTVYVYDDKARLTEEVYYDPTKPVAKTVYTYDRTGSRPSEYAFFLSDGRKAIAPVGPCLGAHRIKSTYDEKGRTLTQDVFDDDGSLKKGYRWTYDDRSNIASYISKTRSSTVTFTYSYEFDAQGNWIKRTAKATTDVEGLDVFGEPATPYVRTTITSRKITYF